MPSNIIYLITENELKQFMMRIYKVILYKQEIITGSPLVTLVIGTGTAIAK